MLRRVDLIGTVNGALGHLFAAYSEEREKQDLWIAEVKSELTCVPPGPYEQMLRTIRNENMNALAGCIALLGDNVSRRYASEVMRLEDERKKCGRVVYHPLSRHPIATFGALLAAAANAARHASDSPFHPWTEEVITRAGIKERDESVVFQLLEIGDVHKLDDIINDLDIVCGHLDAMYAGQYP